MQSILKGLALEIVLVFLPLCLCAAADSPAQLPADVALNEGAGRGGFLILKVRVQKGKDLPFIVDTGTPVTLLSETLEPQLGKRLGSTTFQKYGKQKSGRYAAPEIYLGDTLLETGTNVFSFDFKQLSSLSRQPVMGVLGFDCLRRYCIQLDFEKGTMRFLSPAGHSDVSELGKAFHMTLTNLLEGGKDVYPVIDCDNLCGIKSPKLLIDTGCNIDGLVEKSASTRLPECFWNGGTYTNIHVGIVAHMNALGLRFLARHLVTLDFPEQTMYLKQKSVGPLPKKEKKSSVLPPVSAQRDPGEPNLTR